MWLCPIPHCAAGMNPWKNGMREGRGNLQCMAVVTRGCEEWKMKQLLCRILRLTRDIELLSTSLWFI